MKKLKLSKLTGFKNIFANVLILIIITFIFACCVTLLSNVLTNLKF